MVSDEVRVVSYLMTENDVKSILGPGTRFTPARKTARDDDRLEIWEIARTLVLATFGATPYQKKLPAKAQRLKKGDSIENLILQLAREQREALEQLGRQETTGVQSAIGHADSVRDFSLMLVWSRTSPSFEARQRQVGIFGLERCAEALSFINDAGSDLRCRFSEARRLAVLCALQLLKNQHELSQESGDAADPYFHTKMKAAVLFDERIKEAFEAHQEFPYKNYRHAATLLTKELGLKAGDDLGQNGIYRFLSKTMSPRYSPWLEAWRQNQRRRVRSQVAADESGVG